jgi:hypothetical protein
MVACSRYVSKAIHTGAERASPRPGRRRSVYATRRTQRGSGMKGLGGVNDLVDRTDYATLRRIYTRP